jgi:hypothetical protein
VPLRDVLAGHDVSTAYERGWAKLKNGELLDAAEREGFEVFVTTDTVLRYQQNLSGRRICNRLSAFDQLAQDSARRSRHCRCYCIVWTRRLCRGADSVITANRRFEQTCSGGLRPPSQAAQPER